MGWGGGVVECVCKQHLPSCTPLQAELSQLTGQVEELDGKNSTAERSVKSLKEQLEELQEKMTEETRAKIAANNRQKQLDDEVERLNAQLEDEEEAKSALQTKLVQVNQQVSYRHANGCLPSFLASRLAGLLKENILFN